MSVSLVKTHNISLSADICKCGGLTEVLKKVRTGLAVRRYRRCLHCKSRFRTLERREVETRRTLNYGASWSPLSAATRQRDNNICQVCFNEAGPRLPVDHIIPFRLSHCNDPDNLITLGPICHAAKKNAEDHLKRGDRLGFERELGVLGWDMRRVEVAFRAWGKLK